MLLLQQLRQLRQQQQLLLAIAVVVIDVVLSLWHTLSHSLTLWFYVTAI
jgi:hypothetical protein